MMNFELDDSGLTFLDSLDSDKVNYQVVSRIKPSQEKVLGLPEILV